MHTGITRNLADITACDKPGHRSAFTFFGVQRPDTTTSKSRWRIHPLTTPDKIVLRSSGSVHTGAAEVWFARAS